MAAKKTASKGASASRTTKKQRKTATNDGVAKRLSALDAAARVLAETGEAMSCPDLIAQMAAQGYWTSPGGKTPQATLYAAFLREIKTKAKEARFIKSERGKFALAR